MSKEKLSDLKLDKDLHPRNDISSATVTMLCDAMEKGDPIPPIIVDQVSKRIVDGFHRYEAHKRLKLPTIEVIWRRYKNDAEIFADAVRLNRTHGRAFDPYDIRRAVQKLEAFGFKPQDISDIVRIPKGKLLQFNGAYAKGPQGTNVVIKQGLVEALRGRTLTTAQVRVNEKYSGYQPAYHVNQLLSILQAGIVPQSSTFIQGMNDLCALWLSMKKKVRKSA